MQFSIYYVIQAIACERKRLERILKTNALSTIARIADVIIAQNAKHKTWRKDGQAYEFAQISETVLSLLASSSDGSEIS
jgi:hypothetical protein